MIMIHPMTTNTMLFNGERTSSMGSSAFSLRDFKASLTWMATKRTKSTRSVSPSSRPILSRPNPNRLNIKILLSSSKVQTASINYATGVKAVYSISIATNAHGKNSSNRTILSTPLSLPLMVRKPISVAFTGFG